MVPPVIIFLLAFFISAHLTGVMRWVSLRWHILDHPGPRKLQAMPIPCLGGVAIVAAVTISLLLSYGRHPEIQVILAVGAGIACVGVLDDLFAVRAAIKLFALAAGCAVLNLYDIGLTRTAYPVLNYLLTFFWVAGIASAFNAMDNADGLAGSITLISALTLFLLGWSTWQLCFSFLAMALAGSVLGFLHHNMKPARIYMGDSGSFYLGYILAVLIILGDWSDNGLRAFMGGVLVLLIPIYDLGLTTLLRIRHGVVSNVQDAIAYSDRDHLSHRLIRMGMTHGKMVTLMCAASAACCAAGMLVVRAPLPAVGLVFALLTATLIAAGVFVDARSSHHELWVNGRSPKTSAPPQ